MIDAVLSYHTNPHTCGVAKFNQRLARELGVTCQPLRAGFCAIHPLVSVKFAEVKDWRTTALSERYDAFIHDEPQTASDWAFLRRAERVFAANPVIASAIRGERSDVMTAWCPSTLQGDPTRGTLDVLTFGMAHKLQTRYYEKLKTLLDDAGPDYTVSVSTAIHEGSPWDETAKVADTLRAIFGDHLRVLGYLADDALVAEMARASAIALFFDPAVRANNTTFWAAVDSGRPVITNLDESSPREVAVYNIETIQEWRGMRGDRRPYPQTWHRLVPLIQAPALGQPCPTCGVALAAACGRCRARITPTNRALLANGYGCEACQGKRTDVTKTLGQEDSVEDFSKAQSG